MSEIKQTQPSKNREPAIAGQNARFGLVTGFRPGFPGSD